MTWAWMDDGFHENPQTLEAGLAAVGLYTCATCYCARHLTDGIIPERALLRMLDAGDMAPLNAAIAVGYLKKVDDGYEVVDYLAGNLTKEVVEERRTAARQRAKAAANARWNRRKVAAAPAAAPAEDIVFPD